MNAKVFLAVMEQHALIWLMVTTVHVPLVTTTPIAKTVKNTEVYKINLLNNLEINECESYPCSNGATCIDVIGSYHCVCLEGYNNSHCENGNIAVSISTQTKHE